MMTREEWEQQVPEAASAILDLGKKLGFHESAHPVNVVRAALDVLREAQLARRVLWAFRVLAEHGDIVGPCWNSEQWAVNDGSNVWYGNDPDEARCAAAIALFPTLSDVDRAKLGECP